MKNFEKNYFFRKCNFLNRLFTKQKCFGKNVSFYYKKIEKNKILKKK